MSAGLPPQHLVDDSGREQLADPPEPHEPRRQEILIGQAVLGVGGDAARRLPSRTLQRRLQVREGRRSSLEKSTR